MPDITPVRARLIVCATLLMLGISIPSLVVSAWAQAPSVGRQQLQGHLLPEFARSPLVGALADTTKLALAIALPLRNRSQLDTLMQQVSDPGSPQFRHYLTAAQFAAQFGPTDQDYQALITFVRAKGLTVTNVYANHVVLDVSGAASAIENAFYVKLNIYRRPDGSTFYAPDREPSLDLDVPVLHITGLDNYFIPKHSTLPHTTMESARRSASNVVPVAGSGPNGAFAGSDFRNAYAPGVKLTGQGQSVGILEFDGFFNSDPAAYKAKFGINVPVQVVTLNGFAQSATQSGPNGAPGGGQDVEVALDIEMAMAMAPGLQSVVVYEGSNADSILAAMVSPPSGIPKSFQLSASWTGWHPTVTTQQLFEMMGTMDGQTFFVSAGDGRAICPSEAGDDRALPFVTVVGGTILAMNGAGLSWQSETAASAGGGIEQGVPIPSYQTGLATGANGGPALTETSPMSRSSTTMSSSLPITVSKSW